MDQTNIGETHAAAHASANNHIRHDRPGRSRSGETGERAKRDLERWRAVGRNLAVQVDEQVQKRPYVAVGAAAGLGFVAGSLFGSRLGQMLLAIGMGYAVKAILGDGASLEALEAGLERMTGEAATD